MARGQKTRPRNENALEKITIHNLQRLRGVTLEFARVGLTAIVGVNGSGKSTVLRALACVYQPKKNIQLPQEDYRPAKFFIPYEGCDWSGCSYEVRIEGQSEIRTFKKEEGGTWVPIPTTRFHRYVKYIGIGDSVPHIELDNETELISFARRGFWDAGNAKQASLLRKVSETLNRNYRDAGVASKETGNLRSFMYAAVTDRYLGELNYPSHFMGAGEQKIFEIIKEVVQAPVGALILIEEPEVSLHNKAMHDLMVFLKQQADEKLLQIVISTHWLAIREFSSTINFYSLSIDPDNEMVLCRSGIAPEDFLALSGDRSDMKRITIWVEDVLARRIVEHLAGHLGVRKFIKKIAIGRSAQNLFAIAAALAIEKECIDDVLIVGDGDRDTTDAAKNRAIVSLIDVESELPLDGPETWVESKRRAAAALVCEFASPNNINPEDFLLTAARALATGGQAPEWLRNDLSEVSRMRPNPTGKKAFYELALSKSESSNPELVREELGKLHERFIQAIASTSEWNAYIKPVADRLLDLCRQHQLIPPVAVQEAIAEVAG